MSYSRATNSDLIRLKKVDDFLENLKTIRALLERDEALEETAEIIAPRWASRRMVFTREIAILICKTQSASLYESAVKPKTPGTVEMLILYEGKYPDQDIEGSLMDQLYEVAGDDSNPWRRAIVEAVIKVGTVDVIPILEAILWDNAKSLDAKVAIANAVSAVGEKSADDLITVLIGQSASGFQTLVAEAIDVVKRRGDIPFPDSSGTEADATRSNESIVKNAHFELDLAISLVDEQPKVALMCVRRGAEAIGKHLYRYLGLEESGKTADKLMLGDLLKVINKSDAPRLFKDAMATLKPYGNFASHDQDDASEHLSSDVAKAMIRVYEDALSIYEKWIRQSASE